MRKILFWLHLSAGLVAGIVILIMCVTGVALAWEKQINAWFEHRALNYTPSSESARLAPEELLNRVKEQRQGANPSSLVIFSDLKQPAEVGLGRQTVLVDPSSGAIAGERVPSPAAGFFRVMEDWHRWFGATGENRSIGKALMDGGNLIFFFIVLSGLYLWFPRKLTWLHFRPSLWFRSGLRGKARDWNWHTTIGFWSWVPLVLVVGSGVIMSYQWANDLLYTTTGSPIPQFKGPPPIKGKIGDAKGKAKGPGGPGGFGFGFGGGPPANWDGLNAAFATAERQVEGWASIRVQGSGNVTAPFNFTIDSGDGGQPQSRGTLAVNRTTAEVERWSDFSSQSLGARLRSLARWTHTGESLGFWGQTIAGIATAGGMVMVYTGIALSVRRWWAWRRRKREPGSALENAA